MCIHPEGMSCSDLVLILNDPAARAASGPAAATARRRNRPAGGGLRETLARDRNDIGENGVGEAAGKEGADEPVLVVELVANRFLRKLVRVLVATAVREAGGLPLVHFSALPESFLSLQPPSTTNVSLNKCSRQAEKCSSTLQLSLSCFSH